MKRYEYGLNCQTVNFGKFYELIPVAYIETAPGETFTGTFQTRLMSESVNDAILNRTYHDYFAFYCPFRLLDDTFPDFIAGKTGSVPTINNTFPQNFERGLTLSAGTVNTAWLRYMYNFVWNTYFRHETQSERTSTDNSVAVCNMRPSTFHESLYDDADTTDVTVASATTVSINELRQGFAEDRWNRIREFYGSKYTDYMRSVGVRANWSVLEEPELISKKHCDLPFRITKATSTGTSLPEIGDPAGLFDGVCTLKIRKTFTPEHGLIGVYAVPRMEVFHSQASGPTVLNKNLHDKYWSPEYEKHPEQIWNADLFGTTGAALYSPKYEDYRKACNLMGPTSYSDGYSAVFSDTGPTSDTYRTRTPSDLDSYFTGSHFGTTYHYQLTTTQKVRRETPISPGYDIAPTP